jgi:hypothetical protein
MYISWYKVVNQFSNSMKECLHFMDASVLAENTSLQGNGNLVQFIVLESTPEVFPYVVHSTKLTSEVV